MASVSVDPLRENDCDRGTMKQGYGYIRPLMKMVNDEHRVQRVDVKCEGSTGFLFLMC